MQMTQKQSILDHLRSGKTITPLDALNLYGSFRLSSIIHDLRQEGFNIKTELNKEGKHYAIYSLEANDKLF